MKLDDFKLSSMLEFKPLEGRLLFCNDRMLLFRQAAFAFLRQVLQGQLGGRVTHALLSQFGYRCGYGDYQALSTAFDWETERDQLGCGPLMHCWEGIVAVEPVAMQFDRERGEFDFRGIWRNSYESEIFLASNPPAEQPICSSLTGYASGWCSAFFGKDLLAIEEQCAGMGHEHCRWRVRPAAAWGDEANHWRAALEATNLSIASELEQQVQARTQEISQMLDILRQKNLQLEELDQLKSEFLANVSHELRTPLTLMLGPLRTLLEREQFNPTVTSQLQRMQRSGTRLHRLVDQLLDFARCQQQVATMRREWVDAGLLLQQLVDEAHAQAEVNGIQLTCKIGPGLERVALDVDMFEKMVVNLLGNALKFCASGDAVEVELRIHESELLLVVADSGPGIDPRHHELIFQRFRQVDASARRRYEGTGIGLALVKEYTEMHGGWIELQSALGKGARFAVHLPLCDVAAEPIPRPGLGDKRWFPNNQISDDLASVAAHSAPLVLIAEDHADLRAYMVSLLSDRFRILQAVNGRQALRAVRQYQPKVVLTDVMMPELDGISLTQLLKADPLTQHIPVIVVTARAGAEASTFGLVAGADDYIIKPFTAMELGARVDAALRMRDLYDGMLERNDALTREIALRKKAEEDRNAIHQQLLVASREAGRAEVATSILHNAGNLLNSVSTSIATLMGDDAQQPVVLLRKIVRLIEAHRHELGAFFESAKGLSVLSALDQVSSAFASSQALQGEELRRVSDQIGHLAVIVSQQNDFAKSERFDESTDLNSLVHQAIDMIGLRKMRSQLVEELHERLPEVVLDRHKALQILFNLLKNAVEALRGIDRPPEILVRTSHARDSVSIEVSDNGVGIPKDIMLRIFNSGFTTKPHGNGFGLHASANLARELGGRLVAFSKGPGHGATFTLWLPLDVRRV